MFIVTLKILFKDNEKDESRIQEAEDSLDMIRSTGRINESTKAPFKNLIQLVWEKDEDTFKEACDYFYHLLKVLAEEEKTEYNHFDIEQSEKPKSEEKPDMSPNRLREYQNNAAIKKSFTTKRHKYLSKFIFEFAYL